MKKYFLLGAPLILGLLITVVLIGSVSRAQGPEQENTAKIKPYADSNPTLGENEIQSSDAANQPIEWLSSDPPPEGVDIQSPPDRVSLAGVADAEAMDATYNAYLRIVGAALKPRESNVEWTGASSAGGCIYASSGFASAVFNVPVTLPQGATVKYVRMYYHDTNASVNSSGWFTVYDLYGQVVDEWQMDSSGDTGNGYVTTAEFTHTIDYGSYSYVLNWRPNDLGASMQICGFRIYYASPSTAIYLPLITKGTS